MSNDDEFPELPPARRRRGPPIEATGEIVAVEPGGLTEAQRGELITGGLRVATDVTALAASLVNGYVEIGRIRAQAVADVARIDAETRRIEAALAGEVARLVEARRAIEARGTVAIGIIQVVTAQVQAIPHADSETRRAVIDALPRLVELAVK